MEPDNDRVLETRLLVRGNVLGIGYREACVHRATEMGGTDLVRNRTDGSVELMLQNSPKRLVDM